MLYHDDNNNNKVMIFKHCDIQYDEISDYKTIHIVSITGKL